MHKNEILNFNINEWIFRRSSGYAGYDNINQPNNEKTWISESEYSERKKLKNNYLKDLEFISDFVTVIHKEQECNNHPYIIEKNLITNFLDKKYF